MIKFNDEQDELFISKTAIERLYSFVVVVVYATITVFFFRQAYMLASYSKSELPTILLTLYSIIVRIMLISLIRKEDLLEIVPTQGTVWEWLREQIEKHFYPIFVFLVTLIVMSEPHVGYGKYVSYLLWGVVGTIILIRIFMFVYLLVKRYSNVLFFKTDGEIQRERFMYAKSAYGLFVIASFLVLAFFAAIIGARIWGYTITFQDLSDLLHTEIFSIREGTTDRKEINVISLFQILGFIFGSFVIASAINTFVIRRVFDLLLLDQGVQYTISTITHYLIVAVVIMIGFKRLGLDYVILVFIAPLLLGVGWSLRDYANDFVSYFIILVQRPFKIGDFVRFDGKITGVVRKITPRSIIIREKNSVNVLLPNSKVVNSEITNWNYTRSFTAFPDIYIAVPFSADPSEVRDIMMRVLDANMDILKNPKPIIRLDDFSSNGYLFMVRGHLSSDNVLNMFDIASDVRFELTKALRDNNVAITGPILIHKEM
jgi:small-conductance mechanosensitive channel